MRLKDLVEDLDARVSLPEPEWAKCLFCKNGGPTMKGRTFQESMVKFGGRCPRCKQVGGMIRDKGAEARARALVQGVRVAAQASLNKTLLQDAEWVECLVCGRVHQVRFRELWRRWVATYSTLCSVCGKMGMVVCGQVESQPGESGPLSPKDEEARLRKKVDDNLRGVFG